MVRIAVCAADNIFRQVILNKAIKYLQEKDIIFEIDTYTTGEELLQRKSHINEYSVVFLDLCLTDIQGMDVARKIRGYSKFINIVLFSDCLAYSCEGYKVAALRFIIKNSPNFENEFNECMEAIFLHLKANDLQVKFDFHEGKKTILVEDIVYVESNLHRLFFYLLIDGKIECFTLYEKLDVIEDKLLYNFMCRIHKSYLVNMNYIDRIVKYSAFMRDGTELSIPKAKFKSIEQQYLGYKESA